MARKESRPQSQENLNNRKEKQVQKGSGTAYHFNIDALSLAQLKDAKDWFASRGERFTLSVIVRRAIRFYGRYLNGLLTEEEMSFERIELKRAMKGIL